MVFFKLLYLIIEFDEVKYCIKYYEFEEDYGDLKVINLDIEICLRLYRVGSFIVIRKIILINCYGSIGKRN